MTGSSPPPSRPSSGPNRRASASPGPSGPAPPYDAEGRYHAHGRISWGVVGVYIFLFLVILLLFSHDTGSSYWWVPWVLGLFVVALLARYVSTNYRIDDMQLAARRLFGGRRIRLDEIRRIEYIALHDLAPGGTFFGGWGWHGRMWSPQIGSFDAIFTDAAKGLLITAGEEPLYISPGRPEEFARELSRRVRSYSGRLAVDVGDPLGSVPEPRN